MMSDTSNTNSLCAMEKEGRKLSDYEKIRARNIKRNNERLRSLGLISAQEEETSNADSERCTLPSNKRKRPSSTKSPTTALIPARKSLRLQGIGVDLKPLPSTLDEDDVHTMREERVKECREARMRAAKDVAVEGAVKAAKENPTATYAHCLMRVKTMAEKALINRVKVIERAAGRHCVVKMAIFKSCLQDEGMWELAEIASDALERLKGLQAPPE